MKRLVGSLVTAVLLATALGCSLNASGEVGVTKSEALVAGCQNLGEVSVGAGVSNDDLVFALSQAAREKGANYVLIQADGARSGSAYKCGMPQSASGGR